MAAFDNPFDPSLTLNPCECGGHASQADHDAHSTYAPAASGSVDAQAAPGTWFDGNQATEAASNRIIEQAVVRAIFVTWLMPPGLGRKGTRRWQRHKGQRNPQ